MIKVEFILDSLVYSNVVPYSYDWNDLEERGFLFSDGWRVPFRDELTRLFDHVEESRGNYSVWSASNHAIFSGYAWVVGFNNGFCYSDEHTYSHDIRLVREIAK